MVLDAANLSASTRRLAARIGKMIGYRRFERCAISWKVGIPR